MNLSEHISNFIKLMDKVRFDYQWNQEEMLRLDQLTQDYLHKLELQELTYHQLGKLAAELKQCRVDRRKAKEALAIMEPFLEFLDSDKGKMTRAQLDQTLGRVRKEEKKVENQCYTPRVMDLNEFQADGVRKA